MLAVSSTMYSDGAPFNTISLALAALAVANFLLFDGTKQGLALAVVCAVGAPAAELVLMQGAGVWHYPDGERAEGVGVEGEGGVRARGRLG